MIKNFIAFDFETSNGKNPCSIGIVEFENGNVINEYYSLIKPKELYFNPYATRVHGISLNDVLGEREFPEIWEEIKHYFDNKVVVAHNFSFDVSVLNHSFEIYKIEQPTYEVRCTLSLSRSYLEIENHKLSTVAKFFKVRQENYHNALDDAFVCGKIFVHLMDYANSHETLKIVKLKQKKNSGFPSQQLEVDKINTILYLKSDKLVGKKIVVSGVFTHFGRNDLKKSIEDNGGKVASAISSKTTFVIAGDNMGPSKLAKAESLGIPIISEFDYLKLIE